jgi:hypothetical protein
VAAMLVSEEHCVTSHVTITTGETIVRKDVEHAKIPILPVIRLQASAQVVAELDLLNRNVLLHVNQDFMETVQPHVATVRMVWLVTLSQEHVRDVPQDT